MQDEHEARAEEEEEIDVMFTSSSSSSHAVVAPSCVAALGTHGSSATLAPATNELPTSRRLLSFPTTFLNLSDAAQHQQLHPSDAHVIHLSPLQPAAPPMSLRQPTGGNMNMNMNMLPGVGAAMEKISKGTRSEFTFTSHVFKTDCGKLRSDV